jgi:hypothetical protein
MKVNIHGRTEATITFNTLGIILRGNDPSELGSVARGIDLVDESQINEVRGIEKIGLIRVEEIKDGKKVVTTREAIDRAEEDYLRAVESEKEAEESEKETDSSEKETDNSEGPIEPKAPRKEPSVKETRKKTKKKKEAPKVKEEGEEEEIPKEFDEPDGSSVVVMTSTGAKRSEMVHDMRGEIDDNEDRCKASMDAAKKLDLEEEENAFPEFIDESLLDPSERMGSTAVIGTGGGNSSSIAMQNSALGERPDPNFLDDLDLDDEEEEVKKESAFIDDKVEVEEVDPFIDDGTVEDELGDAFIEI